jgi:transposase InsO family protein
LTDNGSCYRSRAFADALGPDIAHKRTRPYRPQTNGKVERFNRTLARNGRTQRPTSATRPAHRPTKPGCITTITTDPIPGSAATHPSTASAFTTSPGITPSQRRLRVAGLNTEGGYDAAVDQQIGAADKC